MHMGDIVFHLCWYVSHTFYKRSTDYDFTMVMAANAFGRGGYRMTESA